MISLSTRRLEAKQCGGTYFGAILMSKAQLNLADALGGARYRSIIISVSRVTVKELSPRARPGG